MNDDCAASEQKHKTRMWLVSKEEAHWLEEKLKQSFYDEHMQMIREAWLFLRPGSKKKRG